MPIATRFRSLARLALVNVLPGALFDGHVELATVRSLFRSFVKLVEIENHGYCNRTCWFCPNSFLDRRSSVNPMRPDIYAKILAGLADAEYDETLVWARYHEPLAHESIFGNVCAARRALPRAFLTMHTNADYLTADVIERLETVGLDQLRINLYVPNEEEYCAERVSEMLDKLSRRTRPVVALDRAGVRQLGRRRLHMPLHVPDFRRGMSSRGGLLQTPSCEQAARTSACLSPLQHVVIDYNGKGMLCCQARSDAPEHADAVIGDLGREGYTLLHLYRDMASARSGLVNGGAKQGICCTCNVNLGGPDRFGRLSSLGWMASATGVSSIVARMWKSRARRYEP